MSTKTIAVESGVYERLADVKREGESFSKLIGRLLEQIGAAHTGRDILCGLREFSALAEADAEVMLTVVRESRETETWTAHDLR